MRRLICVITICFMIAAMFSGCGLLQKLGLQDSDNDELRPASSIVMNEEDAKKLSDKAQIRLYFANEDSTKLKMEIRYIPKSEAAKSVNNLATVIVNELINGPATNSTLNRTIPKGTKQGARVKINAASATATVDFSKEFIDKHTVGKTAEQLTIYSIVNSLTELKEIQKVKFTINGSSRKEFGSFKFDAAFPRTASLISKDTTIPDPKNNKTTDPKDKKTVDPRAKDASTEGDGYSNDIFNDPNGDSLNVNGDGLE